MILLDAEKITFYIERIRHNNLPITSDCIIIANDLLQLMTKYPNGLPDNYTFEFSKDLSETAIFDVFHMLAKKHPIIISEEEHTSVVLTDSLF